MSYLHGFRDFFENNLQVVSSAAGIDELNRLQDRHNLFALVANHSYALLMMNGHDIPNHFKPITVEEIRNQAARLEPYKDTLLILSFPKRWESKLGKDRFNNLIGEMAKESQVNNYIWGSFSLWNPRIEDQDSGGFYRNPQFHAHDGMLERWISKHPIPEKVQSAIPLDRAPRIMGHSLLTQGRHSFHGYAANQSSSVD